MIVLHTQNLTLIEPASKCAPSPTSPTCHTIFDKSFALLLLLAVIYTSTPCSIFVNTVKAYEVDRRNVGGSSHRNISIFEKCFLRPTTKLFNGICPAHSPLSGYLTKPDILSESAITQCNDE